MGSVKKDAQQEKEGLESKTIYHFTSYTNIVILKSLGYLFFNYSINIIMLCLKKKKTKQKLDKQFTNCLRQKEC